MNRQRVKPNKVALAREAARPSAGASMRATRATLLAGAWLIGLAVVATGGYAVAIHRRPAPLVALPAQLDRLDRPVAELVRRQVAHAQAQPRDSNRHVTLGLVYEANGVWPEAADAFETVVELDRDEPLARYHLAIALRHCGEPEAALTILRALAAEHKDRAAFHHRLGEGLLESGLAAEAAAAFRIAIDRAPSSPEGYVGLADALLCSAEYASAASLATRAVELDGSYKRAHYALGLAQRGLGLSVEAEEQLGNGLGARKRYMRDAWSDRLPEYMVGWTSLIQRGLDCLNAGKTAEAIAAFQRAVALQPDDAQAMNNLAFAYQLNQQPDRAREVLLRAERANPDHFATQINLATLDLDARQFDAALLRAERAVGMASDRAEAHFVRGRALMPLNRIEEALAAFKQAAGLDARKVEVYLDMGDACGLLNRWAEALQHFETAVPRLPDHWGLRVRLGRVYMKLNRLDQAEAALQVAQALAPHEPQVIKLAEQLAEQRKR